MEVEKMSVDSNVDLSNALALDGFWTARTGGDLTP